MAAGEDVCLLSGISNLDIDLSYMHSWLIVDRCYSVAISVWSFFSNSSWYVTLRPYLTRWCSLSVLYIILLQFRAKLVDSRAVYFSCISLLLIWNPMSSSGFTEFAFDVWTRYGTAFAMYYRLFIWIRLMGGCYACRFFAVLIVAD
jgi:hypothetical protein